MKTILVPIDFSECSHNAVKASVSIAMATGARVVLQHNVYTEANWQALSPAEKMEHQDAFRKSQEGKKKLDDLLNGPLLKSIRCSGLMTYGITDDQIVSNASRLNADLILIGSHENEGPDKSFIGSTIQKVLREAACPVLMVKKGSKSKKWGRLAIALDLDHESRKPFEKIKNLITDLDTKVFLVFVNRPNDFMDTRTINEMMDRFIALYPKMKFERVIYNHTDVAQGILDFAEDNNIDWVALITRNRKTKPKYLIGTTETIAYRSTRPILSVNILPEPYPVD